MLAQTQRYSTEILRGQIVLKGHVNGTSNGIPSFTEAVKETSLLKEVSYC
jgi:hypothetical protein